MVDISIIVLSIIQVGDHIRYYKNDQIQVNVFSIVLNFIYKFPFLIL